MVWIQNYVVLVIILVFGVFTAAEAKIRIVVPDGTPDGAAFERNVRGQLNNLRRSGNPYLWKLINRADRAAETITIMPTPDDNPAAWCGKKSPRVSCTQNDPSARGKVSYHTPRPAVIYFIPRHIDLSDREAHRGIVAHELIHAVDRAYGLYHKKSEIRERRAMFFHNMWRDERGLTLFKRYNKKWDVTDYQRAKSAGTLDNAVNYLFTHDDLPK